jgi:hypothetical protein
METTVTRIPLHRSRDRVHTRRVVRSLGRIWRVLRYTGMAATSLFACVPLLLARRPQTSLRLLCIGAFEYLARLQGRGLDRRARLAVACACDFGALRNDFYDQGYLDRNSYRELRRSLRRLVPEMATHRYIRKLRHTERGRPSFGLDRFPEPAAVTEYRGRVLVLSLAWLRVVSRRSMTPRSFRCLVALVGLVQLVDDLLDWKEDWACRRPTYVTAFLNDWKGPSSEIVKHIQVHANRFRGALVAASERDLKAAPFAIAGFLVWIVALVLLKIRFPYERVA